jgi:hypothetical protein
MKAKDLELGQLPLVQLVDEALPSLWISTMQVLQSLGPDLSNSLHQSARV